MNKGAVHLLLVEDNEDDVFFAQRALKEAQVENPVSVANDGQEAIDFLAGHGKYGDRTQYPLPALMLLDLKMPRKSGFEVLEWVRASATLKGIVVVVLSTSRENSDIRRAYQLGANSYLQKPSNMGTLTEMMKAIKEYWLMQNQFA